MQTVQLPAQNTCCTVQLMLYISALCWSQINPSLRIFLPGERGGGARAPGGGGEAPAGRVRALPAQDAGPAPAAAQATRRGGRAESAHQVRQVRHRAGAGGAHGALRPLPRRRLARRLSVSVVDA